MRKYYINSNLNLNYKLINSFSSQIILSNEINMINMMGIMCVHNIFESLKTKFTEKIFQIVINVGESRTDFIIAVGLGYKKISHKLVSKQAEQIIQNI